MCACIKHAVFPYPVINDVKYSEDVCARTSCQIYSEVCLVALSAETRDVFCPASSLSGLPKAEEPCQPYAEPSLPVVVNTTYSVCAKGVAVSIGQAQWQSEDRLKAFGHQWP